MKQKHSWEITDAFWKAAQPLIPRRERDSNKTYRRKPGGGRTPIEPRKALEAIFYVPCAGIQWKRLPKTFVAASAIHAYLLFWREKGFFHALWVAGLEEYDEAKGIDWAWLSGGGCMTKAPLARETAGKNPAEWEKKRQQASPARRRRGRAAVNCGSRG